MSRSQRLKEEQKLFLVLTTGFDFGIKIEKQHIIYSSTITHGLNDPFEL
ncbi:hypothetical protein LKL98_13855 [Bacillus pacificus]|nr:hypothetical protein [Bacillus pacificus]MCC2472113.1 hypothetical protein [Bacillus pacificus]